MDPAVTAAQSRLCSPVAPIHFTLEFSRLAIAASRLRIKLLFRTNGARLSFWGKHPEAKASPAQYRESRAMDINR